MFLSSKILTHTKKKLFLSRPFCSPPTPKGEPHFLLVNRHVVSIPALTKPSSSSIPSTRKTPSETYNPITPPYSQRIKLPQAAFIPDPIHSTFHSNFPFRKGKGVGESLSTREIARDKLVTKMNWTERESINPSSEASWESNGSHNTNPFASEIETSGEVNARPGDAMSTRP